MDFHVRIGTGAGLRKAVGIGSISEQQHYLSLTTLILWSRGQFDSRVATDLGGHISECAICQGRLEMLGLAGDTGGQIAVESDQPFV